LADATAQGREWQCQQLAHGHFGNGRFGN
jgi:hypothetical protein